MLWRFCLLAGALILGSVLGSVWLMRLPGAYRAWALVAFTLMMLLLSAWLMYRQLAPMLALFRAVNGTVIGYQDGDYSFSLHWPYKDELAELAEVHNALGNTLREQRLNLVQRELLLDTMVQNTPVAMLLVADNKTIVFANIAARQLLHHGRQLEGFSLQDILQGLSPAVKEAIEKGGDGLFTVAAGSQRQAAVADICVETAQIQPEEDDDGDEVYHLARRSFSLNGKLHTLFLLRHLTTELRRQEVQTWKKVIRVISHELNNSLAPLTSLAHSGQELLRRGDATRLPQILETIADRSRHLETFIHGYARFAKLPAPLYTTVSWHDLLTALQAQIPFQLAVSEHDTVLQKEARMDRAQMEQALLNLLKNAHESGASEDGVSLQVRAIHDGWRLDITDNGSGMSDTVMANALVPFYSTKRHGTGLGLALTREIIEAHGGRILLSNRQEGGLQVTLILPA
ncbi:PAS domain-containing sensor histidine kinase [Undibacterium sp. 14-3-2]|uniref:sensor histidine kinase n=1 Tax=Undibacterium sp. 14-3-2 TaxID=2800129 RepID=UPI001F1C7CF4|nr:ATP-binding protein [Undibacterium sp. 14-3-2]